MTFNHYAKMKRIIEQQPNGWVIKKIDEKTITNNFKGETVNHAYYYRIYDVNDTPIKYCKFQQIDRLAKILGLTVEELPLI